MEPPIITLPSLLAWKLLLPHFYHISVAPEKIPYHEFPMKVHAQCLEAAPSLSGEGRGEVVVEVELLTINRFPLNFIPEFFSYGSHNMNPAQFREWYMKTHPGIPKDQPMCIGLYRNIEYFNRKE